MSDTVRHPYQHLCSLCSKAQTTPNECLLNDEIIKKPWCVRKWVLRAEKCDHCHVNVIWSHPCMDMGEAGVQTVMLISTTADTATLAYHTHWCAIWGRSPKNLSSPLNDHINLINEKWWCQHKLSNHTERWFLVWQTCHTTPKMSNMTLSK